MQQDIPLFAIETARGCAWRAFYVYVRAHYRAEEYRKKIAHLGIDPTATLPDVFGAVGGWSFRISIPFTRWRHPQSALRSRWQKWVRSLDGRRSK